ncbi:MAG: FAD-dependent oxidoreductase, partial [Burkholderiales bacterium]|nr:FAD-dependent oxidoreductase [Burkholderiales bacterium]
MRAPVCREGYFTPEIAKRHYVGATFDVARAEAVVREEDHRTNLLRAVRILPGVLDEAKLTVRSGWAGVRCVSRDRLPVTGPLDSGLFCCIALGSRGFSWAPLAAEVLSSFVADA